MRILFSISFLLSFSSLLGQDTALRGKLFRGLEANQPITSSFGDSVFHFHVKELDNGIEHILETRRYFWFYQGELKSTVGTYTGKLLHGVYEKFDREGNLRG